MDAHALFSQKFDSSAHLRGPGTSAKASFARTSVGPSIVGAVLVGTALLVARLVKGRRAAAAAQHGEAYDRAVMAEE